MSTLKFTSPKFQAPKSTAISKSSLGWLLNFAVILTYFVSSPHPTSQEILVLPLKYMQNGNLSQTCYCYHPSLSHRQLLPAAICAQPHFLFSTQSDPFQIKAQPCFFSVKNSYGFYFTQDRSCSPYKGFGFSHLPFLFSSTTLPLLHLALCFCLCTCNIEKAIY